MRRNQQKMLTLGILLAMSTLLTACTKTAPTPVPEQKFSQINSPQVIILDSTWNKYSNIKFKYSLKIPKEYYINQGSCIWDEYELKYNYKSAPSETNIFEKENLTYIYPKVSYLLEDNLQNCVKIENTNESVNEKTPDTWRIYAFESDTQEKINSYIKEEYGQSCSLEVLKPTKNPNEYDVIISKTEDCVIDTAYFFRYSDKTKTGVSIKMGKSFTFNSEQDFGNSAYDEDMLNSFEFTE